MRQPGGNSYHPSYKSYIAYIYQSGTSAPTASVLENTLGGEVGWLRDSEGTYHGTLNGAFVNSKTVIPPFSGYEGIASNLMPIGNESDPISGYYTIYRLGDGNTIVIDTLNSSMQFVDASTILGNSGIYIEIRVYQG